MSNWVPYLKDLFFLLGSIAGVLALLRPVVESKYQKDLERVGTILAKFPENQIMELDGCVNNARRISGSILQPFDEIEHKYKGGWQEVKFVGPLRKVLEQELFYMVAEYRELREFVQVPEWEPKKVDDQYDWLFNKQAFQEDHAIRAKYVEHLEQATDAAIQLKKRYQRIQALTDLHFIEAVFCRYYVPKLFKGRGLECSNNAL
jgi:hypothetical protein